MNKIILSALLLFSSFISAQEVIATQGDYFSNANGSISYTIGEIVIETIISGSNSLTQGFHQTNLTVLGVGDFENNYQVVIFPNPVSTILQLDIDNSSELNYKIFDLQGRLLSAKNIENKLSNINMSNYSKGLYLLALYNESNQKLKTYRIIKN